MDALKKVPKKRNWPLICYAGSAGRNLDRSTIVWSWIHYYSNNNVFVIQGAQYQSKLIFEKLITNVCLMKIKER
jgi:hypothetical protein